MSILGWSIVVIIAAFTLAPFSKIPHGIIRGLAFPRLQWFWLAMAALVALPYLLEGKALIFGATILGLSAVTNAFFIAKFTPLWPWQSRPPEDRSDGNEESEVSLIAANVKQSNDNYDAVLRMVDEYKPDILMLVETNDRWIEALAPLNEHYDDSVICAKETGYGMCLFSKLYLSNKEVKDLVTEGVPSIQANVTLRDGSQFRLYVVHPEPPVASHDTLGRDSEIAKVGLLAKSHPLPAIVSGDLNDVAWSTTTRRFQRLSGLLDPRVGRGFYNTFNAFYPVFRWPLDHLFHDQRFRFISMDRLGKIGSDHFPMYYRLTLGPEPKAENPVPEADAEEKEDVKEMISEETNRSRKPIGTDWED
ncbi:Uncharacterized conserved protein YafD, endonuclease/exonuclease/phosphatase (EEP) superfamily [Cognatiyoonia koreensis]|uniref:Uncharacterized conserved protein YafD, endonuclease/exonuclease/phosphatase (EEP) superfamily n=1 Tax=Cognatiyoonia koreensis TaxID=364200 RepID=A0A1I0NGE5_9RHOB|nr:endonuclease/exonuclease/phosphatase family protein [Cognatiyoonia koreensis]SEW00349.1 Uncharacterized conserved protein YafD, endonuclease/exonuclease/phosphatase (EEP) superfamily [Cognatiyoonia koreensis]